MFQVTQNAAITLDAAKRQQQIPPSYGLRISGVRSSEGGLTLQLGFTPDPVDADIVQEHHGNRIFLAPEVAGPLADAELDAAEPPGSNGSEPAQLVLRAQHPPTEA